MRTRRIGKELTAKSLESCRQKIEWLESVNKDLLEASKRLRWLMPPRTYFEGLEINPNIMAQWWNEAMEMSNKAILKAEGREG